MRIARVLCFFTPPPRSPLSRNFGQKGRFFLSDFHPFLGQKGRFFLSEKFCFLNNLYYLCHQNFHQPLKYIIIMPRQPRTPSPTGIYHVMLRGINHSEIFHDDTDFLKMEKILRSIAKPVDNSGNPKQPICKIFAYCLMTNHLHLLIAEMGEPISNVVKRLGVAYASYFNKSRKRSGPLFEGRFRSEPVDNSDYFITLLHYIHYNPVKAGMTKKPEWYKWSSMHEYQLPEATYQNGICQQSIPFLDLTRAQVRDIVLEAKDPEAFISPIDKTKHTDHEAYEILRSLVSKEFSDCELKDLPKVEKLVIATRAQGLGLTRSQITQFLGVTKHSYYKGKIKFRRLVK